MNVMINGETQSITSQMTVSVLLEYLQLQEKKLAVEVNRHIIPLSQHNTTTLCEGDKIEIIEAIGGG